MEKGNFFLFANFRRISNFRILRTNEMIKNDKKFDFFYP